MSPDPDGLAPSPVPESARTRLATFKVPRDVHIVDSLPRNATDKVLKGELRRRSS